MNWQRLATIALGIAAVTVAGLVPSIREVLLPIAVGILGWATPHPSDKAGS